MNRESVLYTARFFTLVLVQVVVLDHINLFGYINPYLYIYFIVLYPFTGNRGLIILLGFLLGLTIDVFSDTGGVHAAATTFIAYARPAFLKISFGVSYQHNTVKLAKAGFRARIFYIAVMVVAHHLLLFSLEVFSIKHILLVLQGTLFSSIFSIVVLYATFVLFSKK
ncbi:MAG: rod shape-determining protein MreD [Marinirhabdus sp.]